MGFHSAVFPSFYKYPSPYHVASLNWVSWLGSAYRNEYPMIWNHGPTLHCWVPARACHNWCLLKTFMNSPRRRKQRRGMEQLLWWDLQKVATEMTRQVCKTPHPPPPPFEDSQTWSNVLGATSAVTVLYDKAMYTIRSSGDTFLVTII